MVAKKLRVAAEAVTSAVGGFMEKKVTERRLLLAMKNDGQIFVVEEGVGSPSAVANAVANNRQCEILIKISEIPWFRATSAAAPLN